MFAVGVREDKNRHHFGRCGGRRDTRDYACYGDLAPAGGEGLAGFSPA